MKDSITSSPNGVRWSWEVNLGNLIAILVVVISVGGSFMAFQNRITVMEERFRAMTHETYVSPGTRSLIAELRSNLIRIEERLIQLERSQSELHAEIRALRLDRVPR